MISNGHILPTLHYPICSCFTIRSLPYPIYLTHVPTYFEPNNVPTYLTHVPISILYPALSYPSLLYHTIPYYILPCSKCSNVPKCTDVVPTTLPNFTISCPIYLNYHILFLCTYIRGSGWGGGGLEFSNQ